MDDRIRERLRRRNVSYNGFAYLELKGPKALMKYIDMEDTMIFQESWRVEEGKVIVEQADAT